MKNYGIYISPTAFNEMEPGICDAVRNESKGNLDDTDPVYLKLHYADLAGKWSKRGLYVELNADELKEIVDRFEYYMLCWKDSYSESPREYLGLIACGRNIIKKAKLAIKEIQTKQ